LRGGDGLGRAPAGEMPWSVRLVLAGRELLGVHAGELPIDVVLRASGHRVSLRVVSALLADHARDLPGLPRWVLPEKAPEDGARVCGVHHEPRRRTILAVRSSTLTVWPGGRAPLPHWGAASTAAPSWGAHRGRWSVTLSDQDRGAHEQCAHR